MKVIVLIIMIHRDSIIIKSISFITTQYNTMVYI